MAGTTTVKCSMEWTTLTKPSERGGSGSYAYTLPSHKALKAVIETVGADLILDHLHGGKLTLMEELQAQGEEIVRLANVVSSLTDILVKQGTIPECRP